ncbi:uncharacterized protein [Mytilus edulis]|uniref:uncharacterized protein isoform X2 n=1 Tax=Mytilus edulis TaxID=6550 RepID=UPI0039F06FA4
MSCACLDRILLFLYCVITVKLADPSKKIYWTIEAIPGTCISGSNVTLFCNTSAEGLQKATWMKQSDVILHQGLSFYTDKYTGIEVKDGSSLIIMNATTSDFDMSYTCLADVYSYEEVLVINSSSFVCLPRNTNSSWTIAGRNISVHLNLDRFFPVPNCTTNYEDDVLITNQQESVYQENQFFYGTINITSHSSVDICGGSLTVVCMFGYSYSDVVATKFLQDCSVNGNSEYGFKFLGTVIGVGVPFILMCIIVCLLFCYVYIQKGITIKDDKQPEVNSGEIVPFTEVVKCKTSAKKKPENEDHCDSLIRPAKNERTQSFTNFLTDCFNLDRKSKDNSRY